MANRQNFEVSRLNLRQAALQFDINVSNNLNPKAQGGGGGGGGGGGAAGGGGAGGGNATGGVGGAGQAGTTNLGNATGLNLLNALNAILTAQNNLILYWASYERNRINIYRDMDIMQVDERGLWIDPVYQNLGGRSELSVEEPSNVTPPEPTTVQSIRPDITERAAGVVRLVQGASAGQAKVAVEKANHSDSVGNRLARWWSTRMAVDSEASDADDGRDRRTGH